MKTTCVFRCAAALSVAALTGASAAGQFIWIEPIDGEISDDFANPTVFDFGVGTNRVAGTVTLSDQPGGDRDYFTFALGAGETLTAINVLNYDPFNPGFFGIFEGPQATDPDSISPNDLLGFLIIAGDSNGMDILPFVADNGQTFAPPLGEGEYTIWVQQTGTDLTSYDFEFVITPAPGAAASLAMACALAAARRRRS